MSTHHAIKQLPDEYLKKIRDKELEIIQVKDQYDHNIPCITIPIEEFSKILRERESWKQQAMARKKK